MNKTYSIIINDVRGTALWFRRIISTLLVLVVPVGIGILLESSAMQWVGFIVTILTLIGLVASNTDKFKTTDEARAYLDRIDAGDA